MATYKIVKKQLTGTNPISVSVNCGGRILGLLMEGSVPFIYFLCDTTGANETRTFYAISTDVEVSGIDINSFNYIGTLNIGGATGIKHLFEYVA